MSRENGKNEVRFALNLYIEIAARWIEVSVEICQALNLDRNESVEVLSRICQRQKHLNGSRICRESIGQTKGSEIWLDGLKKLSRRSPEISIDRNSVKICREKEKEGLDRRESIEDLSRICREAVKLEEIRFFKMGKIHRDDCNKQATQT